MAAVKMEKEDILETTLFVSNIHCATCTSLISQTLASLSPQPFAHKASILSNRVEIQHSSALSPQTIIDALHDAGFDVESCLSGREEEEAHQVQLRKSTYILEELGGNIAKSIESRKRKRHDEVCGKCRSEKFGEGLAQKFPSRPTSVATTSLYPDDKSIGDAHASARHSGVNSPTQEKRRSDITADLESVVVVGSGGKSDEDKWLATLSIGGMTCSACVNSIRGNLSNLTFIEKAEISALTHSGNVVFSGKNHMDEIIESIENSGFDAEVVELIPFSSGDFQTRERTITLNIEGLHCNNCPPRIMEGIQGFASSQFTVVKPLTSLKDPTVTLKYTPQPDITARKLIEKLSSLDPAFNITVKPAQSLEDRSELVHKAEVRRIAIRLAISIICAIPTFIIGIVFMSLLPKDNQYRLWSEKPIWKGRVTVAEWSLLIISTPVYFFAADLFHVRAFHELRGLWGRKNPKSIRTKLLKFGSMNLLMSLGTTVAYAASLALLAISASQELPPMHEEHPDMQMAMKKSEIAHATYFDAVVFLTMFLLFGRLLESYSKSKSANAVSLLCNLRPKEATLVTKSASGQASYGIETIPVELLEVGDTVQVTHGESPPLDGKVLLGDGKFNESALTGESRLVPKAIGDEVYSGTVNQGNTITVEITSISGKSMLDNIVKIVREGQVQRAPIERVADLVTGYFVPIVSYLAVATWLIWLSLGFSGAIPEEWLDGNQGGWAVWSMSFAIAVFVIACPCGIGLAAPTALFIGTGLAARYGILAKGGGEAFQEASWLDAVVFDKTGTLTMGGEPEVVDAIIDGLDEKNDTTWGKIVLGLAEGLENASGHPLAKAIVQYAKANASDSLERLNVEEVPGRGLVGMFKINDTDLEAYIGNEAFMHEKDVAISEEVMENLRVWKSEAKSVVILAVRKTSANDSDLFSETPKILAYFSVSDQIRSEAPFVISELRKLGVNVYMITGDNAITASAVARTVGIPSENVIAGVLPHEKAEKVKYLQQTAELRRRSAISSLFHRKRNKRNVNTRPRVAMVGDGINDSPALVTADVGIAIGSGSDIALSSAGFILLREDLRQVLLLLHLASKVIRRVKFNFFWAAVYNIIGIPIAAGVLYGYQRTRLDPSWAALAMACSSVSVVASSLLLRSGLPGVGFRARKEWKV